MMDDSFLGFLGFLDFCEVAFEWRGQEFRKTPIGRLCCFRLVLPSATRSRYLYRATMRTAGW